MEQRRETVEIDVDIPIAQMLKLQRKKKARGKTIKMAFDNGSNPNGSISIEETATSESDNSVDGHFKYVDAISLLCCDLDIAAFDPAEIQRLSSSISFVRDCVHLNNPSKAIRFACEDKSEVGKDVVKEIILPSFSSAVVPKKCTANGEAVSSASSEDFVMDTGGSVWALDWCPRVESSSDVDILREFIAVSTHPPDSSYHKLGEKLKGRGVVQIWCLLHTTSKKSEPSQVNRTSRKQESRGRPRKHPLEESACSENTKRQRGRPRKNPLVEDNCQSAHGVACTEVKISRGKSRKKLDGQVSREDIELQPKISASKSLVACTEVKTSRGKSRKKAQVPSCGLPSLVPGETAEFSSNSQITTRFAPDSLLVNESAASSHLSSNRLTNGYIPVNASLPRMVSCLCHNGKVAWDIKWCPSAVYNQHRMGYLAVLLGNGALEVWAVPFPHTVRVIYSSFQEVGTDPRFLELKPIFRCSGIKFGDRYSIPLTLEWSTSSPHDMILAGCHDGTVALWKFCSTDSSADTRPLLCFSADTVPIRAISWAPDESVSESSNVILTAGHKGLKFWDLRDPFRPLWDFPVQRIIYGLDWLQDPRCIVISLDDGTLRILSLVNAANDLPVTGNPFAGTSQQGFHSYLCSLHPIWSVHASRLPGMVAYCGMDGTALRFQLTTRAVEKDPNRNRAPHFLCGSMTEEDSTLTIFTPLPDNPFPMRKSLSEWGDTPRSIRGFLSKYSQEKRANSKNVNAPESNNLLALCYGNEVGTTLGYDNTMMGQNSKQATKLKTSGKKKSKSDELALVSVNENTEIEKRIGGEKENTDDDVETLPPKIVAMHRIRWNRNKGGENWLCFGGAAGILRCQRVCTSGG